MTSHDKIICLHFFSWKAQCSSPIFILSITCAIVLFYQYHKMRIRIKNEGLLYMSELFQLLCNSIDTIFMIYHFEQNTFEYISPNLNKAYKVKKQYFQKNPWKLLDHILDEYKSDLISFFSTNVLTQNFDYEFQAVNPISKEVDYYLAQFNPVFGNNGLQRYVISISNLTKKKLAEQAIKDALLNVEQANEAKKDFLSHMSHEIKTPIQSIISMAQVAKNNLDNPEKVAQCLQTVSDASQNLINLVNQILDLSKMDRNKLNLVLEPFSLKDFLENLSSLTHAQAELSHLTFTMDMSQLEQGPVLENLLYGDPLRLRQILQNCLSNSIKFTPKGGIVKLIVRSYPLQNKQIMIQFFIIDTGIGMSEEFLEKIFLPFEQGDQSIYRKYGGSGLGLSIVKNLVTLMSGDIRIMSTRNKGTQVVIQIPFRFYQEDTLYVSPEISREYLREEGIFIGKRILIAEDNQLNADILYELLKPTQISVDFASNGVEALQKFEESPPSYYQAIFMDIQMSEMDGFEATRKIRFSHHPDSSKISIIAMSADSYPEDIAKAMSYGMNYHLSKPVDIHHLLNILYQILKNR